MAEAAEIRQQPGAVDTGPLRDSLGFLLRLAQIKTFELFFAEFAASGLTPGAFSSLIVIHHNPGIRQGVLARTLRIKPAHMTKMMRAFEEDDMVRRRVPDDDRRAVELSLTALGRDVVIRNLARLREHERAVPAPLDAAEHEQLLVLLAKYVGLER